MKIRMLLYIFCLTLTLCSILCLGAYADEKSERLEKIYRIFISLYDRALTVEDREEAIKIMDGLSYGEACLHYLIGDAEQKSEDIMTIARKESIDRYPGKEGVLRYMHFRRLLDRTVTQLRKSNANACSTFESYNE